MSDSDPNNPTPQSELQESLRALQKAIAAQTAQLQRLAIYEARREWRDLLGRIPDGRRLEHWGRKVYSQNEEDGILEEIFRRIGVTPSSGVFIECGVGNGLENNTHYLLRQGYRGLWIEGSRSRVEKIRRLFAEQLESEQLELCELFVTAEVVDARLAGFAQRRHVTLLSIDLDGNDYWIWKAIRSVQPAVVIIEYNPRCPPPLAVVQHYRPDHQWDGTDYFGASLAAVAKLGTEKGYSLVGCNITGSNAFLVHNERVGNNFPYQLTAENLYHPPRYELTHDCFGRVGHKPAVGGYEPV